MNTSFLNQLDAARLMAAEARVNSTDSVVARFEQEQLMILAKEAGVHVKFQSCSDLRAQCAKVRAEHEIASWREAKESATNNRVVLKCAIKEVKFGVGCC